MKIKFKSLLIASVCALAFQTQTGFAKMYGKLDIGIAMPLSFDATPTTPIDADGYGGLKAGGSLSYGFGVGAYLTPSLRADVSVLKLDRFKFNQVTAGNIVIPTIVPVGGTTTVAVTDTTTQNIGSSVIQAAFYYDFGNYQGFVPYVGVAAGLAMHDPQGYQDNFPAIQGTPPTGSPQYNATPAGYDTFAGKKTSSLALGIGLGLSYEINKSYSFDIGYMYQDLGKIYTENGKTIIPSTNQVVLIGDITPPQTKLRVHSVKASFMVLF